MSSSAVAKALASRGIPVFIIGMQDALRNPLLADQLRAAGTLSPVTVGSFPTAEEAAVLSDAFAARRLFGRALSEGEVGCWHSHRLVYERMIDNQVQLAVVVEDDMVIDARKFCSLLPHIAELLRSSKPRIAVLYSHSSPEDVIRGGILKRARASYRDAYRCVIPPKGTAAYAINSAAAELALNASPVAVTTADWPPWSAHVGFFLISNSGVTEGQNDSVIQGRRALSRTERLNRLSSGFVVLYDWKRFGALAGGTRGNWLRFVMRSSVLPAMIRARHRAAQKVHKGRSLRGSR